MTTKTAQLSRRQFIIATAAFGGGMAIGFKPADAAFVSPQPWGLPPAAGVSEFTAWIAIGPDDIVTIRSPTPDIGNGVMTQIAMTITEELQCDWAKVRAEFAPANRDFLENGVYSASAGPLGYFSGRSTGPDRMKVLLQVGASARERLKAAAAQQWSVPVAEIEAKNSVLTHAASSRSLRYGEVAEKAAAIKLDPEPAIKPQSAWTFLGKASPAKLQQPAIANGSAVYGMDIRLPNMLYAALLQSPVHGGKLKKYDFDKIKNMPGVRGVAVVDPSEPRKALDVKTPFPTGTSLAQSAIAVVADHYWQARKALDALPIEWDEGSGAQWKSNEHIFDTARTMLNKEGEKIETSRGKAVELIDKQSKVVEAVYQTPYADHVNMEPLNGTALVTADRVDVWHPSQHSQQGFFIAAEETGVPPKNVYFHQTFVGGGFGRRVYGDDVRMVVAVAKKFPGRPIHVIWSREESIRQGRFRGLMATKLKAGLDAKGMPVALHARVSGGRGFSINGMSNTAYTMGAIEHVQVESQVVPTNLLVGPYRGPGYNSNAFFLETFIDECAVAAGIDPVEYRLKILANWPDPGWTKVLKEVAEKAKWGQSLPKGMGQGVAISNWGMGGKPEAGTTVAAVSTVEVSKSGKLKIHAIDVAFDTGRIVNRDAIQSAIEGGVIFGLNMSLNETLTVRNGRIVEGNYDQYPMLRIGDIPKINIHFGGMSGHDRFAEIGEPPVGPIGPSIGNAIFKATGKRLRSTPFRLHDLSWA